MASAKRKRKKKPTTIDQVLAGVRGDKRKTLDALRKTIHAIVPRANECVRYGLAAFVLDGDALLVRRRDQLLPERGLDAVVLPKARRLARDPRRELLLRVGAFVRIEGHVQRAALVDREARREHDLVAHAEIEREHEELH